MSVLTGLQAARELHPDLCAISAPVRDHAGKVIAALTISGPADRFTDALQEAGARVIRDGALELSRLIGYSGAPRGPLPD